MTATQQPKPKKKAPPSDTTKPGTKPKLAPSSKGTEHVSQPIALPSPYAELRIWAEMYHDSMQARISAVNRSERGAVHPDLYVKHIKHLEEAENDCAIEMVRAYSIVVPTSIRDWQVATPGIGEHLLARLLGLIGDPVTATPYHWEGTGRDNRRLVADDPYRRSISQLWSYCGVGDPDRKRRKGQTVEEAMACGIPLAKSVLFLLAQSCLKAEGTTFVRKDGVSVTRRRSPYRDVYDKAREKYADKLHQKDCAACGPKGKPAKAGSAWSPGHQHAAALRKVSKEILRDLWLAAMAGPS